MAVLTSQVERESGEFARRRARMEDLVAELRERSAQVARGGGEKATERHRSRGKLTARERIDRLVDPGGAFLELNALAAWDIYDAQVKGGSSFPLTFKKPLRAQEVADQTPLPCLYPVDSGGAFLPLQDEVF